MVIYIYGLCIMLVARNVNRFWWWTCSYINRKLAEHLLAGPCVETINGYVFVKQWRKTIHFVRGESDSYPWPISIHLFRLHHLYWPNTTFQKDQPLISISYGPQNYDSVRDKIEINDQNSLTSCFLVEILYQIVASVNDKRRKKNNKKITCFCGQCNEADEEDNDNRLIWKLLNLQNDIMYGWLPDYMTNAWHLARHYSKMYPVVAFDCNGKLNDDGVLAHYLCAYLFIHLPSSRAHFGRQNDARLATTGRTGWEWHLSVRSHLIHDVADHEISLLIWRCYKWPKITVCWVFGRRNDGDSLRHRWTVVIWPANPNKYKKKMECI